MYGNNLKYLFLKEQLSRKLKCALPHVIKIMMSCFFIRFVEMCHCPRCLSKDALQ